MIAARRIIVALDHPDAASAQALVERLGAAAPSYKIGLQLLSAAGPALVRGLVAAGKEVFLDLKLLEIPHAVAGAVTAAGQLGVRMVTVHASGGSAVLRAAVEAARPYPQLRVLALTVITSLREQDLPEIGVSGSLEDQVLRLARLAVQAGCHGLVASPQEARLLRTELPAGLLIVTPGIQLAGSDQGNDQARIATPAVAIAAGASHLLIGRAISAASDPVAVFDQACRQIEAAALAPAAASTSVPVLRVLEDLERALHRPDVRHDADQLRRLLHPAFREFGYSGRSYELEQILERLPGEPAQGPEIRAQDFRIESESAGSVLLSYRSAHLGSDGGVTRHSLRSSLWLQTANGWQMRFHQATPTEAFEIQGFR